MMKNFFSSVLFAATMLNFNSVVADAVDINTADALTIAQNLKGVGIKNAERIVEFRTINGPFRAIHDLAKVKGIADITIERNKQDILVSK